MFLHKYKVGDEVFYRLSQQSKPGKTISLEVSDWKARIPENKVSQSLEKINSMFSGDEATTEIKEEKVKTKASLHNIIRATANRMK